jgi:hypothetical protein
MMLRRDRWIWRSLHASLCRLSRRGGGAAGRWRGCGLFLLRLLVLAGNGTGLGGFVSRSAGLRTGDLFEKAEDNG